MATHDIEITVNGTTRELTVASKTLLVHALRDELGYTGPKVGCQSTTCGACTVHIDGDPVKSCTMFAVQADGASITTVEGLGDAYGYEDELHPVQETFKEAHGLQCGYCTPGMLMTAAAHIDAHPETNRKEIREALEGNLCRCTGYQHIIDAVESAAERIQDDETDRGIRGDGGIETEDGNRTPGELNREHGGEPQ